jgi:hypothetical protein
MPRTQPLNSDAAYSTMDTGASRNGATAAHVAGLESKVAALVSEA